MLLFSIKITDQILICIFFHCQEKDRAICVSNIKGNFFYSFFFSFLLPLGPPVPKSLGGHSMLEIHGDAFIFGGDSGYYSGGYNSAIYQLTCSSGICSWSSLNQELKVARFLNVAIPVPDNFCKGKEGMLDH